MAIQLGDNGPAVLAFQQQLVDLGFPLAVDGDFGARTDDAVRGFQSVLGLGVDGIVGPITEQAMATNSWQDALVVTLVNLPLARRATKDTVTTNLTSTTLAAEVKWPLVFEGHFYDTTLINQTLTSRAQSLIDDLAASPPAGSGSHTISGELEATLIGPSLVGTAGVFDQSLAGSAEVEPIIMTANLDLPTDAILAVDELFMPGSDWLEALRNVVLLTFAPAAGIAEDVANYQNLSITPEGVRIHLYPEQLDLPSTDGVKTVDAKWNKIEGVIRPSIVARANGHPAGGPGPHVS